jgi:hypothetical protein
MAHKTEGPFRAEVLCAGESRWAGNALRFDTKADGLEYAQDLASRWTLVKKWRVVTDDTPEREDYNEGSEDGSW